MSLAGIRNHFAKWREWEPNPIVVKELRQAVRSWTVTGMMLLFLTGLFVISVVVFVSGAGSDPDEQLGADLFTAFAVVLAIASLFFIPLYLGIRVAAERQDNNPDLYFVSTLSPSRIILGKFLCGLCITVLFFSACMPFMAFTNQLRGVDLPTIFFILFYLFLSVCAINMLAIFLGCLPATRPFKILFGILGIIASIYSIGGALFYVFRFIRIGVGSAMGGRMFWIHTFTSLALYAAVTGLFYVMAVALVSPPSSNRALPVRLYMTVAWFLTGLLIMGSVAKTGHSDAIHVWFNCVFYVLLASLIVVVSNSDTPGNRVRRAIPRAPWKRFLALLFFNGAAGGLVWVALMMAATFLFSSKASSLFPAYAAGGNEWLPQGALAIYIFAYSLTALFIHRTFFPRRPPKIAGLIAIFITGACALTPSVILFFMNQLTTFSIEHLELGNVINIFSMRDDSRLIFHFDFALAWLVVIVALNARWFFNQLRNFVPPPGDAPPVIVYAPANETEPRP